MKAISEQGRWYAYTYTFNTQKRLFYLKIFISRSKTFLKLTLCFDCKLVSLIKKLLGFCFVVCTVLKAVALCIFWHCIFEYSMLAQSRSQPCHFSEVIEVSLNCVIPDSLRVLSSALQLRASYQVPQVDVRVSFCRDSSIAELVLSNTHFSLFFFFFKSLMT